MARLAGIKKGIAIAAVSFGVGTGIGLFTTNGTPKPDDGNSAVKPEDHLPSVAASKTKQQAASLPDAGAPNTSSAQQSPNKPVELSTSEILENTLIRGDALLIEVNASAAITQFKNAITLCEGVARDRIVYRIAICQESMGDLDRALENYRTLSGQAAGSRIRECAALGQARVWIEAGRQSLSKPFLCELLVNSESNQPGTESVVFQDAFLLLGFALARDCQNAKLRPLTDKLAVVDPNPSFEPTHLLKLIKNTVPAASQKPQFEPISINHRRGDAPDEIELSMRMQRLSVLDALKILATNAKVTLDLSEKTQLAFKGRTVEIAVAQVTLARLFDLLLVPHDAMWQVKDDTVQIRLTSELDPKELHQERIALAQRTLQLAASAFPENPFAANAFLELGNIAFRRNEFQAAEQFYEQILRQYPRSPLKASASFNRAKSLLQVRNGAGAKDAFLFVIDSGTGQHIEAVAYVQLAAMALDDDQIQQCIRFARRAIALRSDRDSSSLAPLILSMAYLLKNRPTIANGVLMESRNAVRRPPYQNQAAFLSALARYRAARAESRKQVAGRALVSSLANLDPKLFASMTEFLVVAKTYEQLEMIGEAQRMCELALEDSLDSKSRDKITFALADYHIRQEQVEKAKPLLLSLSQSQQPPVATLAMKKLAQVALLNKDEDDCLHRCQKLLRVVKQEQERAEVLNLMGRVYEQRGDFHNAAICFSGMVPKVVSPISHQETAPK